MMGHGKINKEKHKDPQVINASPVEQVDHYQESKVKDIRIKNLQPGENAWLKKALQATGRTKSASRKLVHMPTLAAYTTEYGKRFNEKLNIQKRLEKMENHKSALFQKKKNAIMIKEAVNRNSRQCLDRMEKMMTGRNVPCEDGEVYRDLAMFMGANEQEFSAQDKKSLLDSALGTSVNGEGAPEGQDMKVALGLMTKALFAIDIPSIRLDSDVLMAGNAEKLEAITGQVYAYENMLERYGKNYFEEINENTAKVIQEHLEKLRLISAYYVSRKEVVTDMEYSTHYDEELTLEVDETTPDSTKQLAEKIMNSTVLAAKLMEVSGVKQKDRNGVAKAITKVKSNASKQLFNKSKTVLTKEEQRKLLDKSVKKMSYFGVNGFGVYSLNAKNCGASFGSLFKNFNDLEEHGNFFGTNSIEMKLVKRHIDEFRKITSGSAFKLGYHEFKYQMAESLGSLVEACRRYRKSHDDKHEYGDRYESVGNILASAENCYEFVGSLDQKKYEKLVNDNKKQALSMVLRNSDMMLEKDDGEIAKTDQMLLRKQSKGLEEEFYNIISESSGFYSSKKCRDNLKKQLNTKVGNNEQNFNADKAYLIKVYGRMQEWCKFYLKDNDPSFESGVRKVDLCCRINDNAARMITYLGSISFADRLKMSGGSGTWADMLFGNDISKMREVKTGEGKRIESEDGEKDVTFLESKEDLRENSYKNIIELAGGDVSMLRDYRQAQLRKINGEVKTGLAYKSRIDERVEGHGNGPLEYKSAKEILDAANENNMNIVYSDVALRQLTTIRIMDTLFGKKKRRLDTIKYNARTQALTGEPVIFIKSVCNISNDGYFGKQEKQLQGGEDEGIESSVLDEKGDLNIEVYDRTVADKIMALTPEVFFESFTENEIQLTQQDKDAFTQRLTALQNAFRRDMTDENGWRKRRDKKDEDKRLDAIKNEENNLKKYKRWGKEDTHYLVVGSKEKLADLQVKKVRDGEGTYTRALKRQIIAGKSLGLVEPEFLSSIKTLEEQDQNQEQVREQEQIKEEKKDLIVSPAQQQRVQKAKDKIKAIKESRSNFKCASDRVKMKIKGDISSITAKTLKRINEGKFEVSQDFKDAIKAFDDYAGMDVRVNKSLTIASTEAGFDNAKFLEEGELMLKGLKLAEKELAKIPEKTKDAHLKKQRSILEPLIKKCLTLKDGNLQVPDGIVPYVVSDEAFKKCKTDTVELKITEKKDLEWKDMSKYPLFAHEPSVNDMAQGQVGDCYALSTIAAIVDMRPSVIKNMMKDNGDTVTVKFCTDNGDKYVTVKKTVPVYKRAGEDIEKDYYVRGALWIQMLEKAIVASGIIKDLYKQEGKEIKDSIKDKSDLIAMLEKDGQVSYELISGGDPASFARFITGKRGTKRIFNEEVNDEYEGQLKKGKMEYTKAQEAFISEADELNKGFKNYVLTASTKDGFDTIEGSGLKSEDNEKGVYIRHAYAVVGTRMINGEKTIVLRNPWGIGTNEAVYDEKTGAVTQQITFDGKNEGYVFMPVDTFFRMFNSYAKNEL
ncbi:calpain family cysteine protease [Butyrivibrio sp. DSM 10294]|uniref:C2 family cysteine protease n=1 Tax=Butyrivibrio sp. DSM 10294 TaxID=2972457 RepID=UPI00234ECFEC|nr:C2 family cysteine protease [Butyrivibrio sp. DSM 10294]MDC7292755.1 calpain family cysteine protease [Butyrivibrio sp. DSM 10294]